MRYTLICSLLVALGTVLVASLTHGGPLPSFGQTVAVAVTVLPRNSGGAVARIAQTAPATLGRNTVEDYPLLLGLTLGGLVLAYGAGVRVLLPRLWQQTRLEPRRPSAQRRSQP